MKPAPGQRVPGRELQFKQMPRRPAKSVRLAFGRAGGVQIGQHGVPHVESFWLRAGDGIVLGPDVQPHLQAKGHTVAMTGDGVNDILAMKDADCSVAMASGSEAAAQAAQVVLLDSDFAHMPDVVYEGRRVVNNIQRSASLFLVKNIFSLLLSLFSVILMVTYPLEPAQVSLISMFTIGVPGFLLALEQNKDRIKGRFITNVMLKALPGGLTDVIAVGALVVCGEVFCISDASIGTIATLVLSVVGFMILFKISEPLNRMKYAVIIGNIAGLVFSGFFLKKLFALTDLSNICILLMIVFGFAAESLFRNLTLLVEKLRGSYEKKKGFNV